MAIAARDPPVRSAQGELRGVREPRRLVEGPFGAVAGCAVRTESSLVRVLVAPNAGARDEGSRLQGRDRCRAVDLVAPPALHACVGPPESERVMREVWGFLEWTSLAMARSARSAERTIVRIAVAGSAPARKTCEPALTLAQHARVCERVARVAGQLIMATLEVEVGHMPVVICFHILDARSAETLPAYQGELGAAVLGVAAAAGGRASAERPVHATRLPHLRADLAMARKAGAAHCPGVCTVADRAPGTAGERTDRGVAGVQGAGRGQVPPFPRGHPADKGERQRRGEQAAFVHRPSPHTADTASASRLA